MADDLTRKQAEELQSFASRAARKLHVHEHTLRQGAMQFASAVETTVGGGMAAALDYFAGTPDAGGSGIPELTVGPVPVVPVVGVLAKLAAIALHVSAKGNPNSDADVAASHLGNFADGILAGATALGVMRLCKNTKAPQIFAQV